MKYLIFSIIKLISKKRHIDSIIDFPIKNAVHKDILLYFTMYALNSSSYY